MPLPIAAAIQLLLTHLYDYRGDATPDASTDEKVWAAIDRMLARFRDPAIGVA